MFCPYCFGDVPDLSTECIYSVCRSRFREEYINFHGKKSSSSPLIFTVSGFSRHGKTVYLTSLYDYLHHALPNNLWPGFGFETLDSEGREILQKNIDDLRNGKLPELTPNTFVHPGIFRLHNIPSQEDRTIVFCDVSGGAFRSGKEIVRLAPQVRRSNCALFLISLSTLCKASGIDDPVKPIGEAMGNLLEAYKNGLRDMGIRKYSQHLIIIYTMADENISQFISPQLKSKLREYGLLRAFLFRLFSTGFPRLKRLRPECFENYDVVKNISQFLNQQMRMKRPDPSSIDAYYDHLENLSETLAKFTKIELRANRFISIAERYFKSVSYTVISSLGAPPIRGEKGDRLSKKINPYFVIDPLIHALVKFDGNYNRTNTMDTLLEINNLLDLFEEEVRDRENRRTRQPWLIEAYLGKYEGIHQLHLFELLFEVELEYRARDGEQPSIGEYLNRFPEYSTHIKKLFPAKVDDYELTHLMGRGGFAKVYRGKRQGTNVEEAIKVFTPPPFAPKPDFDLVRREIEALAQVKHPGIVTHRYPGEAPDGTLYLVMEYVEGKSLQHLMQAFSKNKPMPFIRAAELTSKIADALAAAHAKRVIHRDLKPSNIIVKDDDSICLVDFGLALTGDEKWTMRLERAGTPHYLSPEQWKMEPLDGRTDIWSLGVILYELLTGELPFNGTSEMELMQTITSPAPPRGLRQEIPEKLEAICLRCLKMPRESRYQTAIDLRNELQIFLKNPAAQPSGHNNTVLKPVDKGGPHIIYISLELREECLMLFRRVTELSTPIALSSFATSNPNLKLVIKHLPHSSVLNHSELLAILLTNKNHNREPALFALLDALAYEYRDQDIGGDCKHLKEKIMRENLN